MHQRPLKPVRETVWEMDSTQDVEVTWFTPAGVEVQVNCPGIPGGLFS